MFYGLPMDRGCKAGGLGRSVWHLLADGNAADFSGFRQFMANYAQCHQRSFKDCAGGLQHEVTRSYMRSQLLQTQPYASTLRATTGLLLRNLN